MDKILALVDRIESRIHKIQDNLTDINITALEAKGDLSESEAQTLANLRSYRATRHW